MSNLDPLALYVPTCPSWCEGRHAALLTADPTDDPGLSDFVLHEVTLTADPVLNIGYGHPETAPDLETGPDDQGPCFVRITERGADYPAAMLTGTSQDLRRWARLLTEAADAADQMGDHR